MSIELRVGQVLSESIECLSVTKLVLSCKAEHCCLVQ